MTVYLHSLPLVVLIGTLTACWYSSSSKNAVATQRLMEEIVGESSPSSSMLVLTALQLTTGLCISWPMYQCLLSSNMHTRQSRPFPFKTKTKIILGTLHFLGCLCTNMGFALGSASVVQVIKLMEPIETLILTALANVLILKVPHGMTFIKTISVFTIVLGTAMLLSQKRESQFGHQVNFGSVFFALCSGFAMASRNVYMKTEASKTKNNYLCRHETDGWKQIAVKGLFNYISITSAAAVPGILFLILVELQGSPQIKDSTITMRMFKSPAGQEAIVFHGIYNIASISVLCLISTQSHSLLNVGKRIVNVLYAGIVFGESIGFNGFIGLCIAAMGGILYSSGSNMSKIVWRNMTKATWIDFNIPNMKRKKYILAATLVTWNVISPIFFLVSDPSSDRTNEKDALPPLVVDDFVRHTAAVQLSANMTYSPSDSLSFPKPKRKVILFGPFDRYNFGDLLFEKVLSKLLQTLGPYSNDDILRAGIIDVDMSPYGGHDNILSIKHIQEQSRSDVENGPYDIVYVGGEASGCTHDCAIGMLANEELKAMAKRDKISDCGYLIPKEILRPVQNITNKNVKNFAVINSIGGAQYANPACKVAIDTADYQAFRDSDELYAPDSAVMTKELFKDLIDETFKQVERELFSSNQGVDVKKYIAVQHKIKGLNITELALTLDDVSREAGDMTIVLFAAGTVPGHDSIALYHEVKAAMTQPAIVYEMTNVWKVVALISKAEAVIGTSLHVRIMSFIFFRPRVTWCTGQKHQRFVQLTDASNAPGCTTKKNETWSTLKKYMSVGPERKPDISQEETQQAYKTATELYLASFNKWSNMLLK